MTVPLGVNRPGNAVAGVHQYGADWRELRLQPGHFGCVGFALASP